jgi:hypothetical protein
MTSLRAILAMLKALWSLPEPEPDLRAFALRNARAAFHCGRHDVAAHWLLIATSATGHHAHILHEDTTP